jgi:hypothetical protein
MKEEMSSKWAVSSIEMSDIDVLPQAAFACVICLEKKKKHGGTWSVRHCCPEPCKRLPPSSRAAWDEGLFVFLLETAPAGSVRYKAQLSRLVLPHSDMNKINKIGYGFMQQGR